MTTTDDRIEPCPPHQARGAAQGTQSVAWPPAECATNAPAQAGPQALTAAGELLRALSAPIRIGIVLQLRAGPRCVHELVDLLDVAQPLVSQHLRVLKSAGVVLGDRSGREVRYRLVDDHLAHIVVDAVSHAQEPA